MLLTSAQIVSEIVKVQARIQALRGDARNQDEIHGLGPAAVHLAMASRSLDHAIQAIQAVAPTGPAKILEINQAVEESLGLAPAAPAVARKPWPYSVEGSIHQPTPAPVVAQNGAPRNLADSVAQRKGLDFKGLPVNTLLLVRYGQNGTQIVRLTSVNGPGTKIQVDRFVSGMSWDVAGAPIKVENVIGLAPLNDGRTIAALSKIDQPAKRAR